MRVSLPCQALHQSAQLFALAWGDVLTSHERLHQCWWETFSRMKTR